MNERMLRNAEVALLASYADTPPEGYTTKRFMEEALSPGFKPTRAELVAERVGVMIGWSIGAMDRDWRERWTKSAGGVTQVYEHSILLLPEDLHYELDGITKEQSFLNTLCHEIGHVYARDNQVDFMFFPDCMACSHKIEEAAVELAAMEAIERIFGVSGDKAALAFVAGAFRGTMRDDEPSERNMAVMHHVMDAAEQALNWYEPIVREALKQEGIRHVGG